MQQNINDATILMLQGFEGKRLVAYQDQRGIWTIGIGHTPAFPGQVISDTMCDVIFRNDISWAENAVYGATHDVPTTPYQFGAMVSLTFNIGSGAFKGSTVLRAHRAGDYARAAAAFELFDKEHIDGQLVTSNGLLARRKIEGQFYRTGLTTLGKSV